MAQTELAKRKSIIAHCLHMNAIGLNRGTSGNISIRHKDGLLITPTSMPYERMRPKDIVFLKFDGTPVGDNAPSSEWRFHRDIMHSRPDVNAVVHTHSRYATILAIMGLKIPAIHYMIAAAGGHTIRVAAYALYGTQTLSDNVINALKGRMACLLDHHGMISLGSNLERAMWLATEVEELAAQYHGCLALNRTPPLLSKSQIKDVIQRMGSGYGTND